MNFQLPPYFLGDITATLVFGFVAILLIIAGYKLFDFALKGLAFDDEIKKGNLSMAIIIAALILGICYVVGTVISAIVAG